MVHPKARYQDSIGRIYEIAVIYGGGMGLFSKTA